MTDMEAAREVLRFTFETNPIPEVREWALDERPVFALLLGDERLSHGEFAVVAFAHAIFKWGVFSFGLFGSMDLYTREHCVLVLADWLNVADRLAEDLANR